jgi:hypothetical protein
VLGQGAVRVMAQTCVEDVYRGGWDMLLHAGCVSCVDLYPRVTVRNDKCPSRSARIKMITFTVPGLVDFFVHDDDAWEKLFATGAFKVSAVLPHAIENPTTDDKRALTQYAGIQNTSSFAPSKLPVPRRKPNNSRVSAACLQRR